MGSVYVVGVDRDGLYKIGCSHDPARRLGAIRRATREPGVALLGVVESDAPGWLERYLHAAYATLRVRGEWFRLSPGDVSEILSVPRVDVEGDLPDAVVSRRRVPRPADAPPPEPFPPPRHWWYDLPEAGTSRLADEFARQVAREADLMAELATIRKSLVVIDGSLLAEARRNWTGPDVQAVIDSWDHEGRDDLPSLQPPESAEMLGVAEAAARLGLSQQRVRQFINQKRIKSSKVGGTHLIPSGELEKFAAKDRHPGRRVKSG